ncbi:MAG TPA: TonB-dependent receptor [Rhizomicrobium sp.]|nr:TonB-dependent receptor [Rhizomicrobium sp.]
MRAHRNLRRFLLTTAGATSLVVGIAADKAAADGIETVTVTARRQEETLLDAPVTVTALSGDDLRKQGITDIGSLIQMIPNAVVPDDPQHFNTFINIRGIRQVDAQAEPNFGLYRNGIYYGGQRTNLGSQVDLDRVEVLRGPQAGLYGRDAVGGAVNVIYQMPTDVAGGYASAKYGNYNRTELEGAYTVPLSDNFSVRGAAWWFNQTGSEYYNITLNEQIDRGHDWGGRLSAKADITPKFNIVWSVEYEDVEGPSNRSYAPLGVTQIFGAHGAPETPKTIQRDTPNRSKDHQFYVSQVATYDSDGWGRFNLLASYRDYHLKGIEDQDATGLTPDASDPVAKYYLQQVLHRDEGVKDFYVEGLWTSPQDQPITWIGGVSYFDETFDFSRIFQTSADLGDLLGFGPPIVSTGYFGLPNPGTNFTTRSISAFGEVTWHINEQFELTGGLRWSEDRRKLNYLQLPIDSDPVSPLDPLWAAVNSSFLGSFTTTDSPTFSYTAPTVTLRYKSSDTMTWYATYGTGFRAGGFNTTTTTPALIPYDQETADNYEVGFKSVFADGNVGLNGDVFYMTQSNLLLAQPDPVAPPVLGFTYLANVGDARTWGAELELLAHVTDWLSANASVGWLDPKLTGSGTSYGTPVGGKMVPYTRTTTFNIGAAVDTPIDDRFAFVATANLRLENGGWLDTANTIKYDSLTKLDATAGVVFEEDTRLVAYIKNATDSKPVQFMFGNGAVATTLGRTYGVKLTKTF